MRTRVIRQEPVEYDPEYARARREHAWLLRAEGLALKEIGLRLGVTGARARQLILDFNKIAGRATRRTKWRLDARMGQVGAIAI